MAFMHIFVNNKNNIMAFYLQNILFLYNYFIIKIKGENMRKITVVCIGNLKEKYWVDALAEYKKRISRFFELNIVELPETKILNTPSSANIMQALKTEGLKIMDLTKGKIVCPLCIEGKQLDSPQFSKFIQQNTDNGELCFIIGSSFGLHPDVKKLGTNLSFGKITLPHQLMRVVLLEQIYRAGTILNNIEYHK